MSTNGLITLLVSNAAITLITIYFFWKILRTPSKPEPDSYSENDDVKK